MQTLDYESPSKKKRTSWLFWPAFVSAYYLGIMCVGMVDDAIHIRQTGYPGDGGVAVLGMMAFPFFLGMGIVIKRIWNRCNSLLFALVFPVAAPLLAYLLMRFVAAISK
jgi:hypothetical protein